jgi:predicted dehydrogenase
MAPTRVCVVGCGFAGRQTYLTDLRDDPGSELVAVCDADADTAKTAAADYDVPAWYTEVAAMLAETPVDLLVNVTPPLAHAAVTRTALRAGVHVYSEKPLAASHAEGLALTAEARQAGVRLVAAPDVLLRPAVRALAEHVGAGRIGDVQSASAHYASSFAPDRPVRVPWYYLAGGGVLTDMGSYALAALLGVVGRVRDVTAILRTGYPDRVGPDGPFSSGAEDNAAVLLAFDNGALGTLRTGFHHGPAGRELLFTVAGTTGAVRLRGGHWFDSVAEFHDGTSGWREFPAESLPPAQTGVRHVAACLAAGTEPLLTAEATLHLLAVLDAARESSARRATVAVGTG